MEKPEKPQRSDKNNSDPWKYMGLVSAIGIDLAAFTLGGFFLGSWLDKIQGSRGLWVALGVVVGVLVGIVGVVVIIKAVLGESDE